MTANSAPYQYIFDRQAYMAWFAGIFIVAVAVCFSLWTFTGERTYRDKTGKERKKIVPWSILMPFIILFSCLGLYNLRQNLLIKKYHIVTTGTLTNKYWYSGKHSGWRFKYSYTVKNAIYSGRETYSLNRKTEDGTIKGNCYIVLYDSTHPQYSYMDLQEPVPCDTITDH